SVAAKQLVYIVTVVSLTMMLIALLLRRPIIRLFYGNVEDDVMNAAAVYFLFSAMSYPFLAMYTSGAALFRASGNSRVPMQISLFANILSVGGNVFLIYVAGLGVMGAALSTFISRIVSASVIGIMFYRNGKRNDDAHISLSGLFNFRVVSSMIKNICNIGITGAMESSMFMVGRLLTQRIFVVFGTSAVAANAITSVINSFSVLPGNAFGIALMVVTGQCIGAGNYGEAKRQAAKILKMAFAFLFAMSALTFIFLQPLVSLFNLSPAAHDMAATFLKVHCISMALGWPMSFVLPNALRAAGDVRYVMLVAVISMWTVRVIAAYFFVFTLGLGPIGVWIAMGADFVVRSVSYLLRWFSGKWQKKRVIG
ncbi:MAG: MATE family efflux transporter, partial [Treponema sp.]|nr:MATE family efflux transporter [Treponema sp.]